MWLSIILRFVGCAVLVPVRTHVDMKAITTLELRAALRQLNTVSKIIHILP